ncbi:hypothetical protein WMY93_026739 [Mugilogobius chulae]|uniref:Uncharacterized protein n=1 Tax=Mugilogobius chulae TaxID=88201 RepID=A0AAW0N9F6_9GOBI
MLSSHLDHQSFSFWARTWLTFSKHKHTVSLSHRYDSHTRKQRGQHDPSVNLGPKHSDGSSSFGSKSEIKTNKMMCSPEVNGGLECPEGSQNQTSSPTTTTTTTSQQPQPQIAPLPTAPPEEKDVTGDLIDLFTTPDTAQTPQKIPPPPYELSTRPKMTKLSSHLDHQSFSFWARTWLTFSKHKHTVSLSHRYDSHTRKQRGQHDPSVNLGPKHSDGSSSFGSKSEIKTNKMMCSPEVLDRLSVRAHRGAQVKHMTSAMQTNDKRKVMMRRQTEGGSIVTRRCETRLKEVKGLQKGRGSPNSPLYMSALQGHMKKKPGHNMPGCCWTSTSSFSVSIQNLYACLDPFQKMSWVKERASVSTFFAPLEPSEGPSGLVSNGKSSRAAEDAMTSRYQGDRPPGGTWAV